ncbi:hypothetical protein HYV10_02800 [Candidatus Dependentiae bacterium]|nr:hypothetical protein [Candidatus Dependentiae bacterium]
MKKFLSAILLVLNYNQLSTSNPKENDLDNPDSIFFKFDADGNISKQCRIKKDQKAVCIDFSAHDLNFLKEMHSAAKNNNDLAEKLIKGLASVLIKAQYDFLRHALKKETTESLPSPEELKKSEEILKPFINFSLVPDILMTWKNNLNDHKFIRSILTKEEQEMFDICLEMSDKLKEKMDQESQK